MDRTICIGDKVTTVYGDGFVIDAQSWREKIVDMDDSGAREFSDRCRVEAGLDFQRVWVEVLVKVGGRKVRVLGHQLTVLEGRDGAR